MRPAGPGSFSGSLPGLGVLPGTVPWDCPCRSGYTTNNAPRARRCLSPSPSPPRRQQRQNDGPPDLVGRPRRNGLKDSRHHVPSGPAGPCRRTLLVPHHPPGDHSPDLRVSDLRFLPWVRRRGMCTRVCGSVCERGTTGGGGKSVGVYVQDAGRVRSRSFHPLHSYPRTSNRTNWGSLGPL